MFALETFEGFEGLQLRVWQGGVCLPTRICLRITWLKGWLLTTLAGVGILTTIGTLSTTYSLSPGLQLSSQQKIPDNALDFSV